MSLAGRLPIALMSVGLAFVAMTAAAQVQRIVPLVPGSRAELEAVAGKEFNSVLKDAVRSAPPGGGWTYRLPALPAAECRLTCTGSASLQVIVSGPDGKPMAAQREDTPDGFILTLKTPPNYPTGGLLSFSFKAATEAGQLTRAEYRMTAPDADGNGIPDSLEALLGRGVRLARSARPSRPMTSFQTPHPYLPEQAVPSDAVLVYSAARDVLQSWADAGYTVYCMGGFRAGEQYVREHPGEVQTDRRGQPLVIGGNSYYMVPTAERNQKSAAYYLEAVRHGARGVCPEEPELFASAGYSEAFKKEWEAAYGTPWTPQHQDIAARYRTEQLKAALTVRQIRTILGAVEREAPQVRRILAVHSPITYSHWGIVMPHHALFQLPQVQEVVAQVWTGTARTPNRVAGVRAERTFGLAYLEYASLLGLLDGMGKPAWLLMDPVEDNPDRPMDDYRRNYAETLTASLLFPGTDRFEVMPWPSRIYGRVPPDYATVINTVVGALTECWRYPAQVRAGSGGIGLLIADSLAFQRGDPAPSDFDGVYGLSMPLIQHGIPLSVVSLDRFAESRHLDRAKVLLASYDFLKPPSAAANAALADWVRRGGVLVLFGGTDAYDALPDSWWRQGGDESPVEDLLRRLGLTPKRLASGGVVPARRQQALEMLRAVEPERNLRNRRRYSLDLTTLVQKNGSVCVRFEDAWPEDGWGPYVASLELRVGNRVAASFRTGSELETRFLYIDNGSVYDGKGRFADGRAFFEYRFDNLPRGQNISLIVDVGNGFVVSAYPPDAPQNVLQSADSETHPVLQRLRIPPMYRFTAFEPPPDAKVLYRETSQDLPVVFQHKVDKGTLVYCGMPPGWLTATAQTDRWMRDIVRRACAEAGIPYQEAPAFVGTRGPLVAVRALTKPEQLSGRYVDLLSPDLPVVTDPTVEPGMAGLFRDTANVGPGGLMAVSGRLDAVSQSAAATAFVVRAPDGTQGAARLLAAGQGSPAVRAWDFYGRDVPVTVQAASGTFLLRYANRADGVLVKVSWKQTPAGK